MHTLNAIKKKKKKSNFIFLPSARNAYKLEGEEGSRGEWIRQTQFVIIYLKGK